MNVLTHQGRRFWRQRSRREQIALGLAAAVLALGIAWGAIWEPAQAARGKLSRRNAQLAAEVLRMQAFAKEAETLRTRPQAIAPAEQMNARVLAAFAAQGLKPQRIDVDGRQARVQLEGPFEACLAAADNLRRDSHWALTQARFEATPTPGLVRAQMGWTTP